MDSKYYVAVWKIQWKYNNKTVERKFSKNFNTDFEKAKVFLVNKLQNNKVISVWINEHVTLTDRIPVWSMRKN